MDLISCADFVSNHFSHRCFRRALEDAELVLTLEPGTPKVIYRKVKALFGLDRFDTAIEFIQREKKQRDGQEAPETDPRSDLRSEARIGTPGP